MYRLQRFLYAYLLHRWLGTAVLTVLSIVTVKIHQSNSNFSSACRTVFKYFYACFDSSPGAQSIREALCAR